MYRQNFSLRRVPEVVAQSGAALLHFFSDDAYNMSGFNISYRVGACPTTQSDLECSGNGVCVDGRCDCRVEFKGVACNIKKCPNDCSSQLGQGKSLKFSLGDLSLSDTFELHTIQILEPLKWIFNRRCKFQLLEI